jgi:hypothetical protein
MQKLEEYFLPMNVDAIKEIPISYIAQPDFWAVFWAWHHDKSGGFFSSISVSHDHGNEAKKRTLFGRSNKVF